MQRLFSTFPAGRPGVGLLLLRAAAGASAIVQSGAYFSDADGVPIALWAIALLVLIGGVALLVGFLSPFASVLVALAALGLTVGWIEPPPLNLFEGRFAAFLVVTMASAVACLGPGAFSIDARLFGRREVLIRT